MSAGCDGYSWYILHIVYNQPSRFSKYEQWTSGMPEGGLRMASPYQSLCEVVCSSSILIIHVQETFHNTSSFRWMAVVTYCQHEQHTMLRYVVLCGGGGGEAAVCGSQWGSSPAGDQRSTAVAEAASVIIASIRTKTAPLLPPPPASSQLTRWPLILSLHPHTPLRMFRASHYQLPSSQRRTLSSSLLPKHEGKEGLTRLTPAERNPNMI